MNISVGTICNKLLVLYVPPLPKDLLELRHRIEEAVASVTPSLLMKSGDEFHFRLFVYRMTKDAHIEHL